MRQAKDYSCERLSDECRARTLLSRWKAVIKDQEREGVGISTCSTIFGGMVGIGDCGSSGIADGFGIIEAALPRIGAGDKKSAGRIQGAMRKRSSPHLVITRVFVKQTGKNSGGHVRADAVVGKRFAEALEAQSNTPAVASLNFCPALKRVSRRE